MLDRLQYFAVEFLSGLMLICEQFFHRMVKELKAEYSLLTRAKNAYIEGLKGELLEI